MYRKFDDLPTASSIRLPVDTAYTASASVTDASSDADVDAIQRRYAAMTSGTDIRFSAHLPKFDSRAMTSRAFNDEHPHAPHTHAYNAERFSWCVVDDAADNDEFKRKKRLIHPVANQRMCGSCWAVCMATTMSDCFVVSGTINWPPTISPTFIMMRVPTNDGIQARCNGGNPAKVALQLERIGVTDATCIDYAWCESDSACTSADASKHLDAKIGDALNDKIPEPVGCYFDGERYEYVLDAGSNVYSIDEAGGNVDEFRRVIQAHIVDFGPAVGGFVVLKNFLSGAFTDECVNPGGVYFERGRYDVVGALGGSLTFSDDELARVSGLHAVSIVGWGVEKNVRYDDDADGGKVGDVPYWHCRNSWGKSWGHADGLFKIAMYPFNKIAQFDKRVDAHRFGDIGSMVLVRACKFPERRRFDAVDAKYVDRIKRSRDDDFYTRNDPASVAKRLREDATRVKDEGDDDTCIDGSHPSSTSWCVKRRALYVGGGIALGCVAVLLVCLVSYYVYLLFKSPRSATRVSPMWGATEMHRVS